MTARVESRRSPRNAGNTIYVDSIVQGRHISEEQEEDGKAPPPPADAKLHDVKHVKEQASCSWLFSFWSPRVQGDDTQINPKLSFPRTTGLGHGFQ